MYVCIYIYIHSIKQKNVTNSIKPSTGIDKFSGIRKHLSETIKAYPIDDSQQREALFFLNG
jgi:hypothetical protein